ncbi:unnamed protein product, partial [Ectocarpus fasciculatus]
SAGAAPRAPSDGAAPSAAASPSPSVVGGAQTAADEGVGKDFSDSNGAAAAAATTGATGAATTTTTTTGVPAGSVGTGWGDGPRQGGGGAEDDNSWENVVYVKVGLEVCDCELGVPLDGGVGADGRSGGQHGIIADGSGSRVAAKLGLLLADATWTAPAASSAAITEAGGGGGPGGSLSVETLVSSAAVKLEPEGFDLLEAVHTRVVGRLPLGATGAADPAAPPTGGGDGGGHAAPPRDDDDLAEKLRERLSRGDDPVVVAAALHLPPRPVLSRGQGGGAGAGAGGGGGG